LLLRLDEHLPPEFLAEQAKNSVGRSHISYAIDGHHYALAIDAAAPISGYRADLLSRADAEPPRTWSELLALAHRGLVTVPAIPIDSLMNLFMLADGLGDEPFTVPGIVFKPETGKEALQMLRELVNLSAPGSLERNPIGTWQFLADSTRAAYCPFAYGYSNYSRHGYAANLITVGGLISLTPSDTPLRSTLGGAGLAISKQCQYRECALSYAQFVASPECQSTLYANCGGQPGHRVAWQDAALNVATNNFFTNTLRTLDNAWLRPRFPGYIGFQNLASSIVHHYLCHGGPESTVLAKLDQSLQSAQRANL
jgi:multiple sugar transport system substrate-binding protein